MKYILFAAVSTASVLYAPLAHADPPQHCWPGTHDEIQGGFDNCVDDKVTQPPTQPMNPTQVPQCSNNPFSSLPNCGPPCQDSRVGPGGVIEREPPGCDPKAPDPNGSHAESDRLFNAGTYRL
jgi:hypothetical protein